MSDIIQSAIEIITPVMESAMILGAHYAKACGRDTVTALDIKYAMRYCARHLVGKHLGTLFPELQDGSDSSESDIEEVDEADAPFTRYQGTDEQLLAVNAAHDTWNEWEPFSPVEKMLKSAIDHE